MNQDSRKLAQRFRELHRSESPLVLPNAWDAVSARLIEEAGAKAIATTSAGIAVSHGYPDGNSVPRALAIRAVQEITRVVRVPVSADIEAGYGADPESVRETATAMLDAGAVGLNLEDGESDPTLLCEKIAKLRELGPDLFINARTDVYLLGLPNPVEESVARARAYVDAGADGIFVPGLADPESIQRVAKSVDAPLNVMVVPGIATTEELARYGVARLSVGAGIMQATMALTRQLARDLLDSGHYVGFLEEAVPNAEANALFGPRS